MSVDYLVVMMINSTFHHLQESPIDSDCKTEHSEVDGRKYRIICCLLLRSLSFQLLDRKDERSSSVDDSHHISRVPKRKLRFCIDNGSRKTRTHKKNVLDMSCRQRVLVLELVSHWIDRYGVDIVVCRCHWSELLVPVLDWHLPNRL